MEDGGVLMEFFCRVCCVLKKTYTHKNIHTLTVLRCDLRRAGRDLLD